MFERIWEVISPHFATAFGHCILHVLCVLGGLKAIKEKVRTTKSAKHAECPAQANRLGRNTVSTHRQEDKGLMTNDEESTKPE